MGFRSFRVVVVCSLVLLSATRATAGSLAFAWDPSPEPDVAGYTLAYGTQSGKYTGWIDVGNTTAYTVTLPDGTYYVAVRAYTHDGTISGYSNEVVATIGTASTSPTASSCTTPDPFASMGGGTCYLGGWLPPGMLPAGSTAPAPAPAPVPPTTSAGCTTADPFASMGGGTCYNGGWLPPGMAIPGGGTSAPAPAPSPAPAPQPSAPAPPRSSVGCSTPDPFASMGGGTCYNGGWLPPGMAIPSGGTSAPSPSPAPQPSTPVQSACAGSDPFASMGGGTCYQGGWLPPGMTITVTGTLSVLSLQDELWVVHGDDGTIYASPTDMSPLLLVDGATVTFQGSTLPSGSGSGEVVVVEIVAFQVHH